MKSWNERTSRLCINAADWFSHPASIFLFPIICGIYLVVGGKVDNLTLILSILAISLTQMVLRAQNVDAEATKLQMAELVKATPQANNAVIKADLTVDEVHELKEEIEDAISEKL